MRPFPPRARRWAAVVLVATMLGARAEVTVTVTGRGLDWNGAAEIPRGLFGVHATPLTEERVTDWGIEMDRFIVHAPSGTNAVIRGQRTVTDAKGRTRVEGFPSGLAMVVECLYDRFQPALQMTRRDWREFLTGLGKSYGEHARTTGAVHHLEFWNEPYLNWATLPGVNYFGGFYEKSEASPGAPMRLRATGEVVPNLVWDREIFFARQSSGALDFFASSFVPRTGQPGETVTLRGGRGTMTLEDGAAIPTFNGRVVFREWIGRDVTQKHYWSGEVNRTFYLDMLLPFAQALKEANPDVRLAAGWGFNMFNENWESWRVLYRPTIDAAHSWIDAIHEHHYGGDTRWVAGSYETAYAYAAATYGKRLSFWNTEAGGHLDPEQPGVAKPANEGSPVVRARAAATYFLRDVIYLLAFCPDKAVTRASHHAHENGGDEFAFKLLKPLRGRLMEVSSDSALVWTSAALEGERLTTAFFNDSRTTEDVLVRLAAPPGTTLRGVTVRSIETNPAGDGLLLAEKTIAASGPTWEGRLPCPGKAALVVVAELSAEPKNVPVRRWTQWVPKGEVLQSAKAGAPAEFVFAVDEPRAAAASLRLVLSDFPAGLKVTWNGEPVGLAPGQSVISDHPLPAARVAKTNTLRIEPPEGAPLTVCSAGLFLHSP